MRIGAAFWIQMTDWPALRDACRAAEASGFDALWIDDHLVSDEGDWRTGKLEGWSVLAALASVTTSPTLGLLVGANTFRNPGLTAKLATTLDHLSNGRAILGIGGGWFEREHDAFGLDFGQTVGERLDRLDEAVGLIRRLLDGERVTHAGRFYEMTDAVCEPRPIQARLPILIGGTGPTRTLRTAARYADLWNGYGLPDRIAEVSAVLRERCVEEGRDPEDIDRTVVLDVVVRDSASEARSAYAEIASLHRLEGRIGSDGRHRDLSAGGSPGEVASLISEYQAIGIREVIWIFRSPFDLQTMQRLPEVRAALG